MDKSDLKTIQSWTKEVLIKRGDLAEKIAKATHKFQLPIETLIQSKKGLSAHQRLDIYAAGYVLRLLECLDADYPCLKIFMGDELFELFAKAYIVSLPSESYSLYHFTARFPEYLKTTKPTTEHLSEQQQIMYELPAEIAVFERAKAEIAIEKGTENEEVIVPDMIQLMQYDHVFKTPECLRLLKQKYPIHNIVSQLEKGETPMLSKSETSYIAVTRKFYRLFIGELEDWQYYFLQACKSSTTINEATSQTVKQLKITPENLSAKLLIWIPVAIDLGYLTTQ